MDLLENEEIQREAWKNFMDMEGKEEDDARPILAATVFIVIGIIIAIIVCGLMLS